MSSYPDTCIETNAAADRFLATTRALYRDGRNIRVREQAGGTRRLGRGGSGTAAPAHAGGGLSFAFNEADGRKFAAHLLPVSSGLRDRISVSQVAASAMFIQEIGELAPLPGEVLVKLYGLTHAETRVIGLLATDHTIEEAARALGIALTTARTHLRRIFEKTGTNRQSQLMKLVLSALPPAPGG